MNKLMKVLEGKDTPLKRYLLGDSQDDMIRTDFGTKKVFFECRSCLKVHPLDCYDECSRKCIECLFLKEKKQSAMLGIHVYK